MGHTWGWDVSTSIVGVSLIDEDGRLVEKNHIDLRKFEDLFEKGDAVKRMMAGYDWPAGTVHFVEDRLSGFSPGKSSAGTLLKLGAFNAMVSYFIHEKKGKVVHLHPSSVKATLKRVGLEIPKGGDKKELTLQWARSREPKWSIDLNRNDKPQPWNFDEADAYALAVAGQIRSQT